MSLPSVAECAAALGRLGPGWLIVAIGSVVVLGLAGLVVLSMRRGSSSARYQVWLLAILGVMVLPVMSAMLPGMRVWPRAGAGGEADRPAGKVKEVAASVAPALRAKSAVIDSSAKNEKTMKTIRDSGNSNPQKEVVVAQNTAWEIALPVATGPGRGNEDV